MARLLVLLFSLAVLSAASGSRLLRQTNTIGLANTTSGANITAPTAGNAPTSAPAPASKGSTTATGNAAVAGKSAATGNTTGTGPFAAAIAAAGVPYNVSITTEGLDGALAEGSLSGIPGIATGQVNVTILMPTDEAWEEFLSAGGVNTTSDNLDLETFIGGSFVSGAVILYHAILAILTTADLSNVTRAVGKLGPGAEAQENVTAQSDHDFAVLAESANVITGIPTLFNDTLDVLLDLDTGNVTFGGTYNSTNAQLTGPNVTATEASDVVQAVDQFFADITPPNEATVLFPDIPGPAGTIIHVIDKVLLPGSQEAHEAYAQAFEAYLASLNATAAAIATAASPAPAGRNAVANSTVTPGVGTSPSLAPAGETPVAEAPIG